MADIQSLKEKILLFRVNELQVLLRFAGSVKYGKKQELQMRATNLLEQNPDLVREKILELFRERYHEKVLPYPGYISAENNSSSNRSAKVIIRNVDPYSLNFKENPFFDCHYILVAPTLLKPSLFASRAEQICFLEFRLSLEHSNLLSRNRLNVDDTAFVHLKFCFADTERRYEYLPYGLAIQVNGRVFKLKDSSTSSGVELRRKNELLDITALIRASPMVRNTIKITWIPEPCKDFAVCVQLLTRIQPSDLLHKIAVREIPSSVTKDMIIKQLCSDDDDEDVATTTIKAALKCPLGRERIKTPCRSITCTHVGCFDGLSFLQVNEKKDSFVCPLCNKPIKLEDIHHDRFFAEILSAARPECLEVQFNKDGSWFETKATEPKSKDFELIDLVDSDSDDDDESVIHCKKKNEQSVSKIPVIAVPSPPTRDKSNIKHGAPATTSRIITSSRQPWLPSNFRSPLSSAPTMLRSPSFPVVRSSGQSTSSSAFKHSHHLGIQSQISTSVQLPSLGNDYPYSSSRNSHAKRPRLDSMIVGSTIPLAKQHEVRSSLPMSRPGFGLSSSKVSRKTSTVSTVGAKSSKDLAIPKSSEQTPPFVHRFARLSSAPVPGPDQLSRQYPSLSAMPALLHQNSVGFPSSATASRMYSSNSESPYIYPTARPPPLAFFPYSFPYCTQPLHFFDGRVAGMPSIYSLVPTAAMFQNMNNVYGGDLLSQNNHHAATRQPTAVLPDIISLE